MSNILKNFLKPVVSSYVFPEAEEIETESPAAETEEEKEQEDTADFGEESEGKKTDAEQKISYAFVQAEEILKDAKRKAEELAEKRRQEAEEEINAAKEEAKAEGYRKGYAEGLARAEVESKAKIEEQLQKQVQQVADFLEQASRERDEVIRQAQSELCDLSIAIAEKVIHISLKSSSEVIARMIQVVTEKMKRREWVHIYIGGSDAKGLAQIAPELTVALAGLSDHIKIIPMADDESGTCIIEMPDEIIDASVSTQLQNIRDLLKEG